MHFQINAAQLAVYDPPELKEAWSQLHLIPEKIVSSIETMRRVLGRIEDELDRFSDHIWTIGFTTDGQGCLERHPEGYLKLHSERCTVIVTCIRMDDRTR